MADLEVREVDQQKMKWLIWKREVAQLEIRNG
jgi:hypothetical protein